MATERPSRSILLVTAGLCIAWSFLFVLAMWRVSFALTIGLIVAPALGLAVYALVGACRGDDAGRR